VLELCILRALEADERYGYELVKALAAVPGMGLTEGTLYPLLSRLRVAGLLSARLEESAEGPARKYYALTREGRRTLAAMNVFLEQLNEGMRSINQQGSYEELDQHRSPGTGGLSRT
jgi:PadR family transcriptional regulator PadR